MPRSFKEKASTALYLAVKEHIRGKIQSGAWKIGDRITSEHELVAELGVSRMTVHRGLRELAAEGLLQRVAGVGTFVADGKAESNLLQVVNIAEEIRARGHVHTFTLLSAARQSAPLDAAAALGLATGDSVFHVVGIHLEDGVPMQLEDRYVNPKAAPAFLEQDFAQILPGEYLLRTVPLDDVEHGVDATAATLDEAERLGLSPGLPCLVLTRRTWSRGLCVTFVRCIHPGSRYRLGTRFKPGSTLSVG
jgi:GntR family histidine utilization transcriptional repressor